MNIKTLLITAVASAVLCSCGTSRKAAENPEIKVDQPSSSTTVTTNAPQTPVQNLHPGVQHFVSDLDLSIGTGKDSYDLGGKLFVKENAVVRMNLTFMGFVEVGTIEFTPDYILVVSRMTKEYTKLGYSDWDVLVKNNITFKEVENKAWQKCYAGQGKRITDNELDKTIENMLSSNIKGAQKLTVHIEVGKPDTKRDFDTTTTLKSSYTQVPAQVMITKLTGFMK